MTVAIKLNGLDEALMPFAGRALQDSTVGPSLVSLEVEAGQSFAGETLAANVLGQVGVTVYNSPDDVDGDGVLGEPSDAGVIAKLPPMLRRVPGQPLVKYRAETSLRAKGAATLSSVGFSGEFEASVVLAQYRPHAADDGVIAAVVADLASVRTSLDVDDVLALEPGGALFQQVRSRLSLSAKVSAADTLTGPALGLSRLAGGRAVRITVDGGATLTATISVSDDFTLVLARVDDATWRAGLLKAKTRKAGVSVTAGVTVTFDASELEPLVARALDGVFATSAATLNQLAGKTSLDRLSPELRRLASALMERLGLDLVSTTLDALNKKIEEVRAQVRDTVTTLAKTKVGLAFGYEYSRIRQETTVWQCLLSRPALKRHHADMVRGRFETLLGDGAGVTVEHFLYEKATTSRQSWGFALSLGKWQIGGLDSRETTRVVRRDVRGREQHSLLGVRAYRERKSGPPQWSGDFAATMPSYATGPVPVVSEYEYGIALLQHDRVTKLKAKQLEEWLDGAELWGALESSARQATLSDLDAALGRPASYVTQLVIAPRALQLMLERIATDSLGELSAYLGAAMPWQDLDGRRTPDVRRTLYGPLWRTYLEDASVLRTGRDYGGLAENHLQSQGHPTLAAQERLDAERLDVRSPATFVGLVDLNPRTRSECQSFLNGMKRLHLGILSQTPDTKVLEGIVKEAQAMWAQSLHIRAVGAFLLNMAERCGVLGDVARSITIDVNDGEKAMVVTR